MDGQHDTMKMRILENQAEEFVAMALEQCEERLASSGLPLGDPQKALSAAAMSVQKSVAAFLAVSQISDHAPRG